MVVRINLQGILISRNFLFLINYNNIQHRNGKEQIRQVSQGNLSSMLLSTILKTNNLISDQINLMKTVSTFWSELEMDLQRYNNQDNKKRARSVRVNFQKAKRLNSTVTLDPQIQQLPRQRIQLSLNQIRHQFRQAKDQQQSLRNRIQFLQVQKNRRVQSSHSMRQKYNRVVQIQAESLQQKQSIRKELVNFNSDYDNQQKSKVELIKYEKERIQESKKKLFYENSNVAETVRIRSQKHQEEIDYAKYKELSQKKRIVSEVQVAQQKKAQFMSDLEQKKIALGKKNHQKKIWEQYKKLQLQNRKNKSMLCNFERRTKEIEKCKKTADEEIEKYSRFLRLNKNPEKSGSVYRAKKKLYSGIVKNCFYLTA